jgi:hypothetical protein
VVNVVFTWFAVVDGMWCAVVAVKSGMNGVRCGAWYICTVRCGAWCALCVVRCGAWYVYTVRCGAWYVVCCGDCQKWDKWCALWCMVCAKVDLWCAVVAVIFKRLFCVFLCSFGGAGRGAIAFFGFAGTIHTVKTLCECDLRKNPQESDFCGKDAFF